MSTLQFYAERAAECRRDADKATLVNVRQRSLDAAEAWDAMADRVTRTLAHKEANAEVRALREA